MSSKITLGLTLSGVGMAISLGAPLMHIFLVSSGFGSILALELVAGFPLHLLLSIIGVPIALAGLFLFRRGIKEELSAEALISLEREAVLEDLERRGLLREEKEAEVKMPESSEVETVRRGIKLKSAGLSLICPKCGAETSIGESRCSRCGEKFIKSSDPLRACPVCGADLSSAQSLGSDTYVCSVCFSELEIDEQTAKRIFA